MKIRITSTIRAQQPEAPSHLEPGLSNDNVGFEVLEAPYPAAAVLSHLLGQSCSDWNLTDYDESTGCGAFVSIDLEGPEKGSVLDISSTKPTPATRTVVYRREAEQL